MSIGMMVSINQRLDAETINLVAEEFGFKTEYVSAEVAQAIVEEEGAPEAPATCSDRNGDGTLTTVRHPCLTTSVGECNCR